MLDTPANRPHSAGNLLETARPLVGYSMRIFTLVWLGEMTNFISHPLLLTAAFVAIGSNASSVLAAADPFLGIWKMNPAKGHRTGQVHKIFPAGDNTHDQTYLFMLKKSREYRRTMTVQGDIMKWDEDQELDNHHHIKFQSEFRRKDKGQGIAGEWHREVVHYSQLDETYFVMHIDPCADDGLSIGQKERLEVKFDGREYPQKGESVLPGTTVFGRMPNLRTIEVTEKHNSVVSQTQVCKISEDGRTLVVTVHIPNQSESQVFVFERQFPK